MSRHQICHAHCPGGGDSGIGALVALAVAVLAGVAVLSAVVSFITAHLLIICLCAGGCAAVVAAEIAVLKRWFTVVQWNVPARQTVPAPALPAPARARTTAAVVAVQPAAIEAPVPAAPLIVRNSAGSYVTIRPR